MIKLFFAFNSESGLDASHRAGLREKVKRKLCLAKRKGEGSGDRKPQNLAGWLTASMLGKDSIVGKMFFFDLGL